MPSPIQHIVIIVKENHTFDNYFGTFPSVEGVKLKSASNPPSNDPHHDHETWMRRATDPQYHVQYEEKDIPAYFTYAHQFTLCDHYFSEVAGPSTPNHLMLICADAPIINNPTHHYRPKPDDAYRLASLPEQLEEVGLSWRNYVGYAFHFIAGLAGHHGNHTRDLFQHHATMGKFPSVSWVYADGRPSLTEHPAQNITDGMQWTVDQVNAIVAGGLWNRTAIFITWDDWGGWFDHVELPLVEKWDSSRAQRPPDAYPQFNGQPFRYGSRVPCLVLSPYEKPGHVCSQINSHVSLVKFCQATFGLLSLNERDGGSNGMADCFDFTQNPLPPPQVE